MNILRINNDPEFVLDQFNEFCRKHFIKKHKVVAGTHKKYGLADHMNKTILDRVGYILLGSRLAKSYWGEAVSTITYLINRYPST